MATLTNTKIKDTYDGLLKTTDNEALDVSGVTLIEDGLGNASALSVGRSGNGVSVSGLLDVSGEVQGTSLDINGDGNISGDLEINDTISGSVATNYAPNVLVGGNIVARSLTANEALIEIGGDATSAFITAGKQDGSQTARQLRFEVGTSEKVRITSDGLTFNGDTAAANALDDYEEGTFTPVVADAASGGNTGSGAFSGKYTKIGNFVKVDVTLGSINTFGLTAGNDLFIRNLPFTISGGSGSNPQGVVRADSLIFSGAYIVAWGQANSTNVNIANITSNAADAKLNVASVNSGSSDIVFSLSYFV